MMILAFIVWLMAIVMLIGLGIAFADYLDTLDRDL